MATYDPSAKKIAQRSGDEPMEVVGLDELLIHIAKQIAREYLKRMQGADVSEDPPAS